MSMFVSIDYDEEMFIYLRQLVRRSVTESQKDGKEKKQVYLSCVRRTHLQRDGASPVLAEYDAPSL